MKQLESYAGFFYDYFILMEWVNVSAHQILSFIKHLSAYMLPTILQTKKDSLPTKWKIKDPTLLPDFEKHINSNVGIPL